MKEKNKKIMRLMSIFFTIIMIFNVTVLAETTASDSLIPNPTASVGDDGIKVKTETILSIVQYVGYAFAVGMLIWLGIRYTLAAANERADMKAGSIKYLVGAIIVFSAASLFHPIYENLKTWFNE